MKYCHSLLIYICLLTCLAGCTASEPAPVRDAGHRQHAAKQHQIYKNANSVSNPQSTSMMRKKLAPGTSYKVQAGDTLYGVAWMYDADVKSLIEQNSLKPPYTLYSGQTIHYTRVSAATNESIKRYRVKAGDQLLVLAAKNKVTFSQLVTMNHIKKPYVIQPGQILLIPQNGVESKSDDATPEPSVGVKEGQYSDRAVDQKLLNSASKSIVVENQSEYSNNTKQNYYKDLTWRWPTKGSVIGLFKAGDMGNKGIDIAGQRGQPVYAAASGRVVYAGNALRGYGNLIIIKHNDDYLSAYAHNDAIKVTEQQMVKAGQKIADMGNSESDSVQLHFEIRYQGQSVDPMKYLPKR